MAIIRPIGIPISQYFYNSQEIGLARGLSKLGISVDVYVAGSGSEIKIQNIGTTGAGSICLLEMPFIKLPLIDQAFYPRLTELLAARVYDFIQVNEENELTSFLVARYAHKHGIPVVVYQGMYEQLTGRVYAAYQRFYDRVLLPYFRRYIDLPLVKTSRAGHHLGRKGFSGITVIPVGLDPTPFVNPVDIDWRERFGIPEGDQIILYVGVFENRRNVDFMLEISRLLVSKGVTLLMAGGGPEHARIARRVKDEQIPNVRLVGSVVQGSIPSLYKVSSLFLLPSNYEIFGMVVIEAMNFGVPVISTNTAGPADIIENNVDGVLIGSLDVDTWISSILDLLMQPERLFEMGFNAINKVHNKLLWDVIAKKYFDSVITTLLKSRSAAVNWDDRETYE